MKQQDSELHARGQARFVDDLSLTADTLHIFPLVSTIAHGRIKASDFSQAQALPGVKAILTFNDIKGRNQIGNVAEDEVLLAETEVCYLGQPIALIVADSAAIARQACQLCMVDYEILDAVFDARIADKLNQHIAPARCFSMGDVDNTWQHCDFVVEGQVETGAQEHAYLETQVAIAYPLENSQLKIISATQSPSMVQRITARVLGCAIHFIEVDVLRLGGAFGGKEEQATCWAVMVALAAQYTQHPVKLHLSREEDMSFTGKRHPYSADFKIGLNNESKILAYQVQFYQNAGAFADLSLAILERTLFHAGNAYFIPNFHATAVSCRTNLLPNTAFRGFGAPQALFVLESAIYKAAQLMGVDPAIIQQANLLQDEEHFPYGMSIKNCTLTSCRTLLEQQYKILLQQQNIDRFNATHTLQKKGLALMPVCFGIAFTARFLNQADALVHVYTDGSVSVSTGAVEMGQNVKFKIQRVVAQTFGISTERIKIESTNTSRIPNMSPTAASTGADINGQAARLASLQILNRLKQHAALLLKIKDASTVQIQNESVFVKGEHSGLNWYQLVTQAYLARCGLSAQAHYATANLGFDNSTNTGTPFAYHVYGYAAVEVSVDCLRGRYHIDSVKLVHDAGKSLATNIDLGQIEGAVIQGIGWVTMEEISYDSQGRLLNNNLTNYKIPDIYSAPNIQVKFLPNSDNAAGLLNSKAVGEPPFMYGIAAYFALTKAIQAFNPDYQTIFSAPMTTEKVLLALYSQSNATPKP